MTVIFIMGLICDFVIDDLGISLEIPRLWPMAKDRDKEKVIEKMKAEQKRMEEIREKKEKSRKLYCDLCEH